MSILPFRGPNRGFKGFRVERNIRADNVRVKERQSIPIIRSDKLPPATWPGIGGGIAYDIVTQRPYYSDGFTWFPIGANATGSVDSYAFAKDGDLAISPNTNTVIDMWEITSSDVYHTIPGWNLGLGLFTATENMILTLEVNISWAAGVSNLGDRFLRIEHMKFGSGTWDIIKERVTQADPDLTVETTQTSSIHAKINAGDSIRVAVEHDAPISIVIGGGVHTTISGFKVNP